MFVNYLPFLILTLIGIDRMAEQGKARGLYKRFESGYLHSSLQHQLFGRLRHLRLIGAGMQRVPGQYMRTASRSAQCGDRVAQDLRGTREENVRRAQSARSESGTKCEKEQKTFVFAARARLSFDRLCAVLLSPTGLDILSSGKGRCHAAWQI